MSAQNGIPVPKTGIDEIAAYVPGKTKADPGTRVVKLSSNETPLGPSPKVGEVLAGFGRELERYPDPAATALREAIASAHGLNTANIICGNGSDDLLSLIANAYLANGDEAIYCQHGFLYYRIVILAAGGVPVVAPETDLHADVDEILGCVTERTKLVFLANPNNPTGTYLPHSEVRRLREGLPEHVVLVLDGAYAEYVRRNDYESGIDLVSSSQNVVMTRTFSKIHGLAALRIGWAYAPSNIIDVLNRIRGPFNLNALAIAAGAVAIGDRAHLAKSVEHNEFWLDWLTTEIRALGLSVTPSVGNFILVHFDDQADKSAEAADAFLLSRGYVVRRVTSYGFPNALRMTIGDEAANRGFVELLAEFLSDNSAGREA